MKDVVIVGGGLAGLTAALLLARAGYSVQLLEKHLYPHHKVCGEYVSNEVRPFLESLGAFPHAAQPAEISEFCLSSVQGKRQRLSLDLGGFGISRYYLDHFLCQKARMAGAEVREGCEVQELRREPDGFRLLLKGGAEIQSALVIGAWGKRSRLDKALERPFMNQRSDYIGVKYHIKADLPPNEIALHNFNGGYCGISRIENGVFNLCYLGSRSRLRRWGSVEAMQEQDLFRNPHLRQVFRDAEFLWEKPLVINEVSFEPKASVQDGVLMAGDAAGLITPLCGNGMAMAIHAGKILSELILKYHQPGSRGNTAALEQAYKNAWHVQFARRLWMGRQFQQLFGHTFVSSVALQLLKLKPAARYMVKQTHGKVF